MQSLLSLFDLTVVMFLPQIWQAVFMLIYFMLLYRVNHDTSHKCVCRNVKLFRYWFIFCNHLLFTIKTFKIACLNWLTVYPINLLHSFAIFFCQETKAKLQNILDEKIRKKLLTISKFYQPSSPGAGKTDRRSSSCTCLSSSII